MKAESQNYRQNYENTYRPNPQFLLFKCSAFLNVGATVSVTPSVVSVLWRMCGQDECKKQWEEVCLGLGSEILTSDAQLM